MTTIPKGFSILELLIVVAIILVLAAMAIPAYLAARAKADKGSAINSLRVIQSAEIQYATANNWTFTSNLTDLSIPSDLQTGTKSGYKFLVRNCARGAFSGSCFVVEAFPMPQTKWLNFRTDSMCADESGKLLMSAFGCS